MDRKEELLKIGARLAGEARCPECDLPYAICNAIASLRKAFEEELVGWSEGKLGRLDAYYLHAPLELGARREIALALGYAITAGAQRAERIDDDA